MFSCFALSVPSNIDLNFVLAIYLVQYEVLGYDAFYCGKQVLTFWEDISLKLHHVMSQGMLTSIHIFVHLVNFSHYIPNHEL